MSATITIRSTAARSTTPRSSGDLQVGVPGERRPATSGLVPAATYRRRRAIVGIVLAVLVAASTVLAHDVLVGSGGVPASAAESQPARPRATVTARPGDTLWSIAREHRGPIPISRYVDALVDANGGAAIQAGQAVVLP